MLPKLQLFAINLYQAMFWYLPQSLIDWNIKTGLLCKNRRPTYISQLSYLLSVFSVILFIISAVTFAAQVFGYENQSTKLKIITCLLAIQLSLMWALGILCQVILSFDLSWIEGLNQLLMFQDNLNQWSNYGIFVFEPIVYLKIYL